MQRTMLSSLYPALTLQPWGLINSAWFRLIQPDLRQRSTHVGVPELHKLRMLR
jgi:hypothetical protein